MLRNLGLYQLRQNLIPKLILVSKFSKQPYNMTSQKYMDFLMK